MNLKNIVLLLLVLSLTMVVAMARDVQTHYSDVVNSNQVAVELIPDGEIPELMAVIVQTNDPMEAWQKNQQAAMEKWRSEVKTNHNARPVMPPPPSNNYFDDAKWLPFKTNLLVDLGSGDGKRELLFSFRYKGQTRSDGWSGSGVMVQTTLPFIVITNPKQNTTSQPMVQFQGYCSKALSTIHYDLINEKGDKTVSGGDGFVNDQYFDKDLFDYTTNYFTCYDVQLNPGTNTFVLHCTDNAGNMIATNFVVVFTTVGDTNPPIFKPDWPQDGMSIVGSQFDLRGPCDDPTSIVTAFACDDEGRTTRLGGECERNGYLWVERIPLAEGKNYITVVTTDAAQNSSVTNLMVSKSDVTLYMDPIPDTKKLWQSTTTVTGFYSRTNHTVFVNGVKAKMNPDGHWVATGVPVTAGGTASFDMKTDDDDPPPTNSWLPTICSQPVENNSLSAGISLPSLGTNEYDHYPVYLGMTNTSGANIPMTWMLPVEEARFSLHLYDTNNKEVTKREYFKKSGQVLLDNLNIHHLGKNELTNIDGIISFSTNSTARIASLNLDEHFQLPPPGEYRLEIVARLFKIADDGRLIPFEFPPLSTMVQIIDQPAEIIFYLNDLQRQGKLTWGAELNSLRIGVAYGLNERRPNEANPIEIFLENLSTNDFHNWNLRFPNPNEQFDISLYDSSGNEVLKTDLGKKQGQPLSLDGQNPTKAPGVMDDINALFGTSNVRRGRGLRPVFVSAKDATDCGRFNLNDYFEIKSPGNYKLTYQQRFYWWNTNSTLTGITMPMVTVPLEIH